MLSNYLLVALRTLVRHRVPTIINVFGLSLGIAVCVLVLQFIRHEYSYDSFHANDDRLFRVLKHEKETDGSVDHSAWQPMPVAPALKAEFPEIVHATRYTSGGIILSRGERVFEERGRFVDPDFFKMFSFSFVKGSASSVLEQPNEIVVTAALAEKYFGNEDPIGKTLHMRTRAGEHDLTVVGVIASIPTNSTLQFDFAANIRVHSMYERSKDRWTSSNGSAFVMLAPNARAEDLNAKLPAFVQKYYATLVQGWQDKGYLAKGEDAWTMSIQPVPSMHMDVSVDSSPERTGNPSYALILGGIGVLVLSIACINFVTLAIGRSTSRGKEVGVRKVLGAVRSQLVMQFWGEALLLCALSLAIGLIVAEMFLPMFSSLVDVPLNDMVWSDSWFVLGLVLLLLTVGMAAGSYPALYLSRFHPVDTLKGQFKLGGRNVFTRGLIVFQFGLSIFLVCAALFVDKQTDYLVSKNLGFSSEQVVVLPLYAGSPERSLLLGERLRTRLAGDPSVKSISLTSGAFTHAYDINGFQLNGKQHSAYTYRIDERYLETLQIPLKHGRNFQGRSADDIEKGIIVNEAFLRMMEWPEPAIGKQLRGTDSEMMEGLEVVGVVSDFHFTSLRQEIKPVLMFMDPEWPLDHALIRLSGKDIPSGVQTLRSVWREISPESPFNATFLDEDFRKQYENEMRWGRIMMSASILAIVLASLGLFGLITVAVAARTKEIGIRKVLGASGAGIVRLVSREFLGLVLLGNLLAWPAAYLATESFLENYAYRIDVTPWAFILAAIVAVCVAFIAIGGNVIRAARANPVESLRYE